ncbi:hypothetical protein C0992_002944 [Termitomyces sp. T32_za158]|nr:hypothetical protein C0992_002944 [Termitomyces sp. T32_za158]
MVNSKNHPKGVSRRVSYFRASNTAQDQSRILSTQALAGKRQESRTRYIQHLSGLSSSSIQILEDNTVNPSQDLNNVPMPSVEDDWEDLIDNVVGPEMQSAKEMQDIIHDLRDIVTSRWAGARHYNDYQTWKLCRKRLQHNWELVMEDLTTAYLGWQNESSSTSVPQPTPSATAPSNTPGSTSTDSQPTYSVADVIGTILAIDLYTLVNSVNIHQTTNTSIAVSLVRAGFLGNSPVHPSLAISIKTLELFRIIRLHHPSFSIEAFAKTLSYLYSVSTLSTTTLSDVFDVYLEIRRRIDSRVSQFLGRDTPNYCVLHACPACNYESDYFLSVDFLNKYANEVKAKPTVAALGEGNEGEGEGKELDSETSEGDPTDGEDSSFSTCTSNWKAAARDENKKMWAIFAESGIFASACRHGFILWICDMISSGELAKYGLAMIAKALEVFKKQFITDYQFVALDQSYSINLSQTCKTDTARRQLNDRHQTILIELLDYERRMNIHSRWTSRHIEYQKTAAYIANCKYEKALENLQTLVIKQLFELHKLNLSQTGYQMCTHIAKSLQTWSKTIRAAISHYNNLAIPLGRPTLDWTRVSHYAFLDDFYLLHHSCNDINQKPWADPVICETMHKYQRLQRAKEEIICSRIWDIHQLKGFSGNPKPGISKSSQLAQTSTRSLVTNSDSTSHNMGIDGDHDADSKSDGEPSDELLGDLGSLVDFVSNID